ncbi:hydroxysqualene dehydroxylase HpnE [Rhodoferax sp.]|uniref:hydroxysqualene dehydroxylase HpnE n=1 Tax=Rhodoferax sp. TaxID=50421 RepID=UPI00262EEAAC|nr:hydroxysqualene dehydroxylase HpnE [Rhodoferax sp.]MDD2923865.1 hydroxysqualene dehydroxylase HpnE [Rhodoferax sp.]
MDIAIVGAGWAGLAAAVHACQDGHHVTLFEAARTLGGRARSLPATLPDGRPVMLDNGQHILIGAYTETLRLMRLVGLAPRDVLLDLPLTLQFPDGTGLHLPNWPTPLDALGGILGARGWTWADKWSLICAATRWQRQGFTCEAGLSVAELCQTVSTRVTADVIEPLCVSALNTPVAQADAQVFLRVLRDALFGVAGGSHLLLPRTDLGTLFPAAAADWVQQRGAQLHLGTRVAQLAPSGGNTWQVNGQSFDAVILANSAENAALALTKSFSSTIKYIANEMQAWVSTVSALRFEAIATVYAWAPTARLPQPMLALRSNAAHPAQFVFDRGQLGGPQGLLAFVVSASQSDRATLQAQVLQQAEDQLQLDLQTVQTIVEKRATFACVPHLLRPGSRIAPGLLACGDYVAGPYPATLEGAVRSGVAAAVLANTDMMTDHA